MGINQLQVLTEYVRKGAITWKAAIQLTRDILFLNSNKLYHLNLEFGELEDAWSTGEDEDRRRTDLEMLEDFMKGKARPDFVHVSWMDYSSMPRMRMVPWRKFTTVVEEGRSDIGITKAGLGLLPNDSIIPGVFPTGEYRLHPDFSSLKLGPIRGHLSMYGEFREKDGSRVSLCPRTQLIRAVELAAEQNLRYLVGFEIEFLLLERLPSNKEPLRFETLINDGHAWSSSRYFADTKVANLLRDVVAELESMGIFVEQLHCESAPGQFELVLPPYPPVEAVDTLLHTRDVISALAIAAGYKFTLHPKPFAMACGTASHMHMSIASNNGDKPETYEPFYAGILRHLRAICAFAYANPTSYERLADGCWAGGRWVTWGTQNRETPLRKIDDSHWELKMLDGLANPYLAVAAVLLAGTGGVVRGEKLTWGDCEVDPAALTDNDRAELGVSEMLPAGLEEALQALRADEEMVRMLGEEVVERYVTTKEAELELLGAMKEDEKRQWIMERY
jgi:glutamine synthetase